MPVLPVRTSWCRVTDARTCAGSALLLLLVVPGAAQAQSQSVVGILGIASEVAPIEQRLLDTREVSIRGNVFRVGTLNGRQVVVDRSGDGGRIGHPDLPQFLVACLIVRGITDRADSQAPTNYEEFRTTASENAAAVVTAIIDKQDTIR